MIALIRYIQGYLRIRVTGYSPERFLNLCKSKEIAIWGLEATANGYEMFMKVSGFRKLKPILKKTNTKVTILKRFGLPFFFHKYRKRKLFFAGIVLSMMLIYAMTFFIWKIEINGNQSITDEVLLEYLESQDIYHGMYKRRVDCEQMAKDIRLAFDEIIWVSVSMDGTCLFVDVKENTDTFQANNVAEDEPSDLVADKAGKIVYMITRNGVPQVKVGDEVKQGDILVSGTVEVMSDSGEAAGYHYVEADADILVERTESYQDAINVQYQSKSYTEQKKHLYYIGIGDYRLELGIRKHDYENYEMYASEVQVKLGEYFYLPFWIGNRQIVEYEWEDETYQAEEMEALLKENFEFYCQKLEEQGSVILDKNLHILQETTRARAIGNIKIQEPVGISRKSIDF